MRYAIDLVHEDNGTVSAYAPDIPGAHSFGEDDAEALARVANAIESMLAARIAEREDIPPPSPAKGRPTVALPVLTAAKIGLYQAMRAEGVGKAELARRLGWHLPQIDRALDLNHASRIDHIEAALKTLGREIEIEITEAA